MTSSWKAELYALHVLEFYPGMDPEYPVNQIYLDELRKDADRQFITLEKHAAESGISIQKRIEFGIPSQRIETVATEQQADLIILGTHGRTGLQHVLVGSTAERVVRTGPCLSSPLRPAGYLHRDLRRMPRTAQSPFTAYWYPSTSPNVL